MAKPALIEYPVCAFAIAVLASGAYFVVVFGVLSSLNATLSFPPYLFLIAIPILACGIFHYAITQGKTLSQARRWLQVLAAAFGAPTLAWYLIGFAFVIVTGEGF